VRFGSLLVILIALLASPSPHGDDCCFSISILARTCGRKYSNAHEPVYDIGGIVSSHAIKHLVAAIALWFIAAMRIGDTRQHPACLRGRDLQTRLALVRRRSPAVANSFGL
jgi:hypothetical protein